MTIYHAFGLHWYSQGLDIPELPIAGTEDAGYAVSIVEEHPCNWPELPPGNNDTPFVQMAKDDLRLQVEGIGCFRISDGARIAWSRSSSEVSDQDLRTFLLGSAVGALLIQRGMLVLHGNALVKDGQAIVCLGHSGAGKSTLAYALMQQGWRLLADDLVAIAPDGLVLPGIPRIKLWEDAAVAFGLTPETLMPIRQGIRKYLLMGDRIERAEQPAPLVALYAIQQDPHQQDEGKRIVAITSQKARTLRLRNQAYRPRFVRGLAQEAANFLLLARLQQTVPMAVLSPPLGIQAMGNWLGQVDLLEAAATAQASVVEAVGVS
jgi:hypothetical protein